MILIKRRAIIVRLIGGLGNQLFQYAIGRQLSILNRAQLKIDVSAVKNNASRSYKLDHYNITAAIATDREVERCTAVYERTTLYARAYRKAEAKLVPRYRRSYFKESDYYIYEPELLKVAPGVLIEGFWQHHQYFENLHPDILKELTLKEEYRNAVPDVVSEITQNDHSVSLHIRRGDYVSDPGNLSWFGVMPVAYYQQAMDYICSKVKNPTFYVFSDDLEWAKQNISSKAAVVFVDIDGGTKDYLELDAMSKCRHHIIANSSFSWWGAFLNRNPEKIVVAPEKWIAVEEINKNVAIQFPSWVKL